MCSDKTQVVKELGSMDVEITFINGDTDEEKPLRKYKIDVHRTERFNGFAHFYVNRHPDAAVAYLSLEKRNPWNYESYEKDYENSNGNLTFNALISRDQNQSNLGFHFIRCSLNGQPFKLKHSKVSLGSKDHTTYAVYESKHLSGSRKGSVYKDYLRFDTMGATLPLALGMEDNFSHDISKLPGKWECSIKSESDRETVRTFRFTIDSNGQVVPHAEQQSGNVVFGDWEWMIDMDIPAGGSPLDYRLKHSPEMGFFNGIPWSTPEGRAMAERVPTKGNPFPLPAK